MKLRKASSANGGLDALAIMAEQQASFLTRRNKPPHVTLERIANIAERVQNFVHMRYNRHGKAVPDTRPDRLEGFEVQRELCLKRVWDAYKLVQEREIMHKDAEGKDESWNNAKRLDGNKNYTPEPVYYYGNHFETVVEDELYGYKAQGRTQIKNNDTKGED